MRKVAAPVFYYIVMTLAALLMLAPVGWMLSTSLKPEKDVLSATPRWIPETTTTQHFTDLFTQSQDFPVARWIANSFGLAITQTVLVLFIASMAAFALSRLQYRGRETLFRGIVATMILPAQVTLIPVFLVVVKLGLFNTYGALILPGLGGAFGVFLLRQFFQSIPVELEEAAYLDGAGPWIIYSRVCLPLVKPALATLAIFTFMGSWNDFVWPLIATNDVNLRTLPVGLTIFQGRYVTEYGITMAAAVVATIPMVIAFAIFQKRVTEGIALQGLKG
ncbi:carbohydrate ABC transporter permease [bacterium]|nr:MAG: carbohydrate ABC transporter permease [bacterium]